MLFCVAVFKHKVEEFDIAGYNSVLLFVGIGAFIVHIEQERLYHVQLDGRLDLQLFLLVLLFPLVLEVLPHYDLFIRHCQEQPILIEKKQLPKAAVVEVEVLDQVSHAVTGVHSAGIVVGTLH